MIIPLKKLSKIFHLNFQRFAACLDWDRSCVVEKIGNECECKTESNFASGYIFNYNNTNESRQLNARKCFLSHKQYIFVRLFIS